MVRCPFGQLIIQHPTEWLLEDCRGGTENWQEPYWRDGFTRYPYWYIQSKQKMADGCHLDPENSSGLPCWAPRCQCVSRKCRLSNFCPAICRGNIDFPVFCQRSFTSMLMFPIQKRKSDVPNVLFPRLFARLIKLCFTRVNKKKMAGASYLY